MTFQEKIFWLKNSLLRPAAIKQYNEALNNEALSSEKLADLNFYKRKKIVQYAYDNIPFYYTFYNQSGFHPSMFVTEKDWIKIPILDKKMIRENYNELLCRNLSSKYYKETTTGGSTGVPLKLIIDKRWHSEVLSWRYLRWWGVSPASNMGIISRGVPKGTWSKLKKYILWWPTKRVYLDASCMSISDIQDFVIRIKKYKIEVIQGYVGGIEKVADYIIKNNIIITSVKLVWSSSSPLSKNARERIQKAFNCKVMDQYGSCEIASMAVERPLSNSLSINSDYIHLEIVDEYGDLCDENILGNIIVTNLENYAFPLIRYNIGDKSSLKEKDVTNIFPEIDYVKGRTTDMVILPDGSYLDGSYLTTIFDDYTSYIHSFQVIQRADFSIDINLTKLDHENIESILNNVHCVLAEKTKSQVSIRINIVDHIEDNRGKHRYVISELAK